MAADANYPTQRPGRTSTPHAEAILALEAHVNDLQAAINAFIERDVVDEAVHNLRFEASWALGYLQAVLEERRERAHAG